MRSVWLIVFGMVAAMGCASSNAPLPPGSAWTPKDWGTEETVVLRTECPDEGEYWSPVWLVVLDGELYVRLGTRAAGRVACSTTAPRMPVRIAGHQFDGIVMTPAPEMAPRVQAAMADKYTTDIFVRYVHHPLTLRLAPG